MHEQVAIRETYIDSGRSAIADSLRRRFDNGSVTRTEPVVRPAADWLLTSNFQERVSKLNRRAEGASFVRSSKFEVLEMSSKVLPSRSSREVF
jgi:hypothetical protein